MNSSQSRCVLGCKSLIWEFIFGSTLKDGGAKSESGAGKSVNGGLMRGYALGIQG